MNSSSKPTDLRQGMTSEEMINRSSEWTLAFDNALLNRLKEFSEIVDTASQEINTECETLTKDINRLQSRVFNVTNEFLMLSNTQFVENRVQEFEETMESNIVPQSINNGKIKSKTEKEAELIGKMKEAIQIGVATNTQHDKQISENHHKEDFPQLKLPHLIGTSKFFSSKYCGLADDSKISQPIPEETTSSSSNVQLPYLLSNSSESLPSTVASLDNISNENVSIGSKQSQSQHSYDDNSRHTIASLNQQKYSNDSTKERTIVNDGESINPSMAKPTASIVDDLNSAFRARLPPPPDDDTESDDDFKPTTSKKLFGDDDDDLFGENSLFANREREDSFLFGKDNITNSLTSTEKSHDKNSLFKDNVDGYEKVRQVPVADSSDNVPSTNTQPSETDVRPPSQTRPKIPAGAVPMFGGPPSKTSSNSNSNTDKKERGNVERVSVSSTEGIKATGNSSQHAEKENKATSQSSLTAADQKDRKPTQSQGSDRRIPNSVKQPKPKINSLFAENSDDELFPTSKLPHNKKSVSSNLFDDDDFLKINPKPKTAQLKPKARVKHSIFEDSDSGDDLFSSASSSSSKSKEKPTISNANQFFKPSPNIFTGRATSESLFDDPHEDIFSSGRKAKVDSSIVSQNSDSSDKSYTRPSVPSTIRETYLPKSKDPPPLEEEKSTVKDNPAIVSLPKSDVSKEGVDRYDVKKSVTDKDENGDSETIDGFDGSRSHFTPDEEILNTSAHVDKLKGKSDAKIPSSDLHKNSYIVDSTATEKSQPKPNTNAISSSVSRPQSLQIQPDKSLVCDINSVQEDKIIFSENTENSMSDTIDGNSNVKSKIREAEANLSPSEVPSGTKKELAKSSGVDREGGKAKSSVKSIASSLKINPLALRPGARPPKSVESPSSPVSQPPNDSEEPFLQPSKSRSEVITAVAVPGPSESSGLLSSVAKSRPKILQQRRLPSRKLRKANISTDTIDGKGELDDSANAVTPIINANPEEPMISGDVPILSPEERSEPSSPTVPADILSPSTEEEDIFFGIESHQHTLFGIGITSPDEDSFIKPKIGAIGKTVVVTPGESVKSNPSDANMANPVLDIPKTYDDTVGTSRSLSQKDTTRITLPSSKITQCSDSDSDDLFSSISRKMPQDSVLPKPKVPVVEKSVADLFSDESTTKQANSNHGQSTHVAAKSNAESSVRNIQTSKIETVKVNGQNSAMKTPKSLFSDSDDEDIFKAKNKAIPAQKVQENVEKPVAEIVAPKLSRKQKGLFDSDSDEDNLFGTKVKKTASTTLSVSHNTSSKSATAIKNTRGAAAKSLFSDSSDDDIFSSSKPPTKSYTRKDSDTEKQVKPVNEKQIKKPTDDSSRHHIFDDPLNNM